MGEPSARTVSQLMQRLADAGETRFPIVRYEEQVASPDSEHLFDQADTLAASTADRQTDLRRAISAAY